MSSAPLGTQQPFALTEDPANYVPSPARERSLAQLEAAVEKTRVPCLEGPTGIGKTLLLRVFGQRVAARYTPLYLPYPVLTTRELCALTLGLLGRNRVADPEALLEAVVAELALNGRPLLLLLDDAASLPIETARGLGAIWTRARGRLRVVLSGIGGEALIRVGEAFGDALVRVALEEGVPDAALQGYVAAQLERSQAPENLRRAFDAGAVAELGRVSAGNPRRLHIAAQRILRRVETAEAAGPGLRLAVAPHGAGREAAAPAALGASVAPPAIVEPQSESSIPAPSVPSALTAMLATPDAGLQGAGTPASATQSPVAEALPPAANALAPARDAAREPVAAAPPLQPEPGIAPGTPEPPAKSVHPERKAEPAPPEPHREDVRPKRKVEPAPSSAKPTLLAEPAPSPAKPPPLVEPAPKEPIGEYRFVRGRLARVEPTAAAGSAAKPDAPVALPPAQIDLTLAPLLERARPSAVPKSDPAARGAARSARRAVRRPPVVLVALVAALSAVIGFGLASEIDRRGIDPRALIAELLSKLGLAVEPTPAPAPALTPAPESAPAASPVSARAAAAVPDLPAAPRAEADPRATPETLPSAPAVPPTPQSERIAAPVEPAPIGVSINATPWAQIEIDGQPVGETPLGDVPLRAGPHHFRARFPDGRVRERSVEISTEQRTVVFE